MAILSNINDKFRVDSAGAVYFGTSAGANLQVLQSIGTGGSPTWVDVDDIIGGPYLPLTGGTLTGNLAINGTNTLTVGGVTTLNAALSVGGRATFPSVVVNRPQFPGGILAHDTDDANADIWGISRTYYPSHPTAANAWGLKWDATTNQFRFVGAGSDVVTIDLDAGNFVTTGSITGTTATFSGLVSGITPTAAANFATKAYVDGVTPGAGPFLKLDGTTTMTGRIKQVTSESVIGTFQGTTATGYAEFHIINNVAHSLILGSVGSTYPGADWAGSTYIYNGGSKKMYIKSQNELRLLTGGTVLASNTALIIDTSQNSTFTGLVSGITPTAAANFTTKAYVDSLSPPGGPYVTIGTAQTITANKTFSTLTSFTASESVNLKGIRGQFTNEFMHLYNKVGIGNPAGWGQGETSTPNQGLSTYGAGYFAYGTGAVSTFLGDLTVSKGTPIIKALDGTNNHYLFIAADSSNSFMRSDNNLLLQVDGGNVTALTFDNVGSATFSGYTYFPNYLFHAGDTNTRIFFETGKITLRGDTNIILSGGNVGIGTTSPEHKLVVAGTIGFGNGYNGGVYVSSTSTTVDENWGLEVQRTSGVDDYNTRLKYYPVSGGSRKAGIYDSRNARFSLYSDTNNNPDILIPHAFLGIGNTSPTYRLQLGTSGSLTDSIRLGTYAVTQNTRQYIGYTRADSGLFESSGDGDTPSTVLAGVAGVRIVNTTGTITSSQADNSVQLLTHIYNGGSRVALHASYNGDIGIGTTSPERVLHLDANQGRAIIQLDKGGDKIISMGTGSSATNADDTIFQMFNEGSELVRIFTEGNSWFNGGNVGIGVTGPTEKLVVAGKVMINNTNPPNNLAQLNIGFTDGGETRAIDIDGSWSAFESKSITFTYGTGATNMVGQINCQHISPGSRLRWGKLYHSGVSSTYTMELISTSQTAANLTVAGSITAASDVVAYSDERLKSNIKTLDGSKVLKMRGVSFEKDGKKGSGVIAQELEKVAPELVNNDSEYKGVAYGNLVGYLIEAIKELEARVKELENK